MKLRSLILACALSSQSCGHQAPPPEHVAVDIRGVLVSTDKLDAPPFVVQQRIQGKYQGGDATMDCIVQFEQHKLTVVGLTPFGTRAFVIEQKGLEVNFKKFIDRDLPVQPDAVLYDIHRVFFRGLPKPQADGTHEQQDQSELLSERWVNGTLTERRFQALEGPVSNLVVVTFDGPPAPVIAPHVRITNSAYRYSLEIENSQQKLLDGTQTLEVQSAPAAPQNQPLPVVPPTAK